MVKKEKVRTEPLKYLYNQTEVVHPRTITTSHPTLSCAPGLLATNPDTHGRSILQPVYLPTSDHLSPSHLKMPQELQTSQPGHENTRRCAAIAIMIKSLQMRFQVSYIQWWTRAITSNSCIWEGHNEIPLLPVFSLSMHAKTDRNW